MKTPKAKEGPYAVQVFNESQEIYWEGSWKTEAEARGRALYLVMALSEIQWKASICAAVEADGKQVGELVTAGA